MNIKRIIIVLLLGVSLILPSSSVSAEYVLSYIEKVSYVDSTSVTYDKTSDIYCVVVYDWLNGEYDHMEVYEFKPTDSFWSYHIQNKDDKNEIMTFNTIEAGSKEWYILKSSLPYLNKSTAKTGKVTLAAPVRNESQDKPIDNSTKGRDISQKSSTPRTIVLYDPNKGGN